VGFRRTSHRLIRLFSKMTSFLGEVIHGPSIPKLAGPSYQSHTFQLLKRLSSERWRHWGGQGLRIFSVLQLPARRRGLRRGTSRSGHRPEADRPASDGRDANQIAKKTPLEFLSKARPP
jgi:hypothetical protein